MRLKKIMDDEDMSGIQPQQDHLIKAIEGEDCEDLLIDCRRSLLYPTTSYVLRCTYVYSTHT